MILKIQRQQKAHASAGNKACKGVYFYGSIQLQNQFGLPGCKRISPKPVSLYLMQNPEMGRRIAHHFAKDAAKVTVVRKSNLGTDFSNWDVGICQQ